MLTKPLILPNGHEKSELLRRARLQALVKSSILRGDWRGGPDAGRVRGEERQSPRAPTPCAVRRERAIIGAA